MPPARPPRAPRPDPHCARPVLPGAAQSPEAEDGHCPVDGHGLRARSPEAHVTQAATGPVTGPFTITLLNSAREPSIRMTRLDQFDSCSGRTPSSTPISRRSALATGGEHLLGAGAEPSRPARTVACQPVPARDAHALPSTEAQPRGERIPLDEDCASTAIPSRRSPACGGQAQSLSMER